MAITHAAKKALRQNPKHRAKNIKDETRIKNILKDVRLLISQKKTEEAKKLLPQIYKIMDKAAKTGLIKKNTASRKKSRIAKAISKSL